MPTKFDNQSEIGSTGLIEYRGIIQQDFLRELQGRKGYIKFDEMRLNSPVVGALLLAIENAVRHADWHFESDQGEDDPRLELCEESLEAMSHSWNDHISEALTMLPFGYSLFEIVYQRDGASVLWRKFAIRGQDTIDRWGFDEQGGLSGAFQRANLSKPEVFLPIEKCLLYRTRVERNNPEGRSLLRNAYTSYYYLKNIQQIEGIGIERDLAGMPVITLPVGADTTDNETSDFGKARKLVRNIRRDEQEGIVLPGPEWKLELLSTGGTRQFDTSAIIARYESRILMSCLTQFLMLGQDKVGTQALSTDQTDFFNMSANYIADIISEVQTHFAIPRLLELNGLDPDGISMAHTPVGDVDITKIADFLQKVGSMLTWMPADEAWLREVAELPEVDEADIEAERERKQQVAMQIAQSTAKSQTPFEKKADEKKADEQDQENEMATLYAAGPPDDAERRLWERAYERVMKTFFGGQQRRVISGAKRIKRNA